MTEKIEPQDPHDILIAEIMEAPSGNASETRCMRLLKKTVELMHHDREYILECIDDALESDAALLPEEGDTIMSFIDAAIFYFNEELSKATPGEDLHIRLEDLISKAVAAKEIVTDAISDEDETEETN